MTMRISNDKIIREDNHSFVILPKGLLDEFVLNAMDYFRNRRGYWPTFDELYSTCQELYSPNGVEIYRSLKDLPNALKESLGSKYESLPTFSYILATLEDDGKIEKVIDESRKILVFKLR